MAESETAPDTNAKKEADDYYHNLIARVDDTIVESQDAVERSGDRETGIFGRLLNHHSLTSVCFQDPEDAMEIGPRAFFLFMSIVVQMCLAMAFAIDGNIGLGWFVTSLFWLLFLFGYSYLLRRKHISEQLFLWPYVSGMLALVLGVVMVGVFAHYSQVDGATERTTYTRDSFIIWIICWTTNWVFEALLLVFFIHRNHSCIQSIDADYVEHPGGMFNENDVGGPMVDL